MSKHPTKDFTRISNLLARGKPVVGYHRLSGNDALQLRGVQYISIRTAISYNQAHPYLYEVPLEFGDPPAWSPETRAHFEAQGVAQRDYWDRLDPPKEEVYKLVELEN